MGQTKEYVYHNFPNPDGFTNEDDVFTWDIWTYGDIELHFKNDKLFMIFSHCYSKIDGGESLNLELWFLEKNHRPSLENVLKILNDEKIEFQKKIKSSLVSLILPSQVELSFEVEEFADEDYDDYLKRSEEAGHNSYVLGSFSLSTL